MHLISQKNVIRHIYIGLGANLPHPEFGPPQATLSQALHILTQKDIALVVQSPWYESAPVPVSDQPWYINGIAEIATALPPRDLLQRLHHIEDDFGRQRGALNAARAIDLDLIDYDGRIVNTPDLTLPHPRAHLRAFVLLPLQDIAPEWRHPADGTGIDALIAALEPGQQTRPFR